MKMSEKKYEKKKERKQNPVFQEVKSESGFLSIFMKAIFFFFLLKTPVEAICK